MLHSERENSYLVRRSRFAKEKKEQSHLFRSPDRGVRKSHTFAREGGSERDERVDSTVKEGRFQGGERGQAKKTSLEESISE